MYRTARKGPDGPDDARTRGIHRLNESWHSPPSWFFCRLHFFWSRTAGIVKAMPAVAADLGFWLDVFRTERALFRLGAAGRRSRIGLTLAIRDCTSFSYVLLRLIRFCFFLPAAPRRNSARSVRNTSSQKPRSAATAGIALTIPAVLLQKKWSRQKNHEGGECHDSFSL